MEGSRPLSQAVGGDVYLKCENLQRTGSFKIRGAYVRIARLSPEVRARGVVAASAGNHAQGVALAASLLDCHATVFMPEGAPLPKVAATEAYGATIRMHGSSVDDALAAAVTYAEQVGATFIHPFDHPDIIAGQGTLGLEILEQCPEAKTIVVSVGGGGLISGVAAAVKARRPDVTLVGVQAAGASSFGPSVKAGHPIALTQMSTIADGIAVKRPGEQTLQHVLALVDRVETVTDEEIARALLLGLERAKLVIEPAGAAALAAVMSRPEDFEAPVVVVLSGGNIDPLLLSKLITHGLDAAGRFLSLRVRVTDRPGTLASFLEVLAQAGANVLEVNHMRTGTSTGLDQVDISVELETRGPTHCASVIAALKESGYTLS